MKIFVKNMVCDRCKMVVKGEFEKLGLNPLNVALGEVGLANVSLAESQFEQLAMALIHHGFELLTDKKRQLVTQVKSLIVALVHYSEDNLHVNLSVYLSEKLGTNYAHLSSVFAETEHDTIERFFIRQKIEKAKELLSYGDKSLSEIAYFLNYSSVAHLSAQFKKVTGETASSYRQKQELERTTLDKI